MVNLTIILTEIDNTKAPILIPGVLQFSSFI
jgi:hypothetical protein